MVISETRKDITSSQLLIGRGGPIELINTSISCSLADVGQSLSFSFSTQYQRALFHMGQRMGDRCVYKLYGSSSSQ
jgi:hypothetical protein